jgi:hypothetical protein
VLQRADDAAAAAERGVRLVELTLLHAALCQSMRAHLVVFSRSVCLAMQMQAKLILHTAGAALGRAERQEAGMQSEGPGVGNVERQGGVSGDGHLAAGRRPLGHQLGGGILRGGPGGGGG